MGPNRSDELRLTVRRLSILVASVAVIFGVLVPVLQPFGGAGFVNPTLAILLLSPWVLGILLLALDRHGPVKYWAAPILVSLMAPVLVACHDWCMIQTMVLHGIIPSVISTVLINLCLIGAFTFYLVGMWPRRCLRCGHWTLIPLLKFWGQEKRTVNTRRCGACGSKFWRRHRGEDWKVERRWTWIDGVGKDSRAEAVGNAKGQSDSADRGPTVVNPAPHQEEPSLPSPPQ
jgi:hypothetical protein